MSRKPVLVNSLPKSGTNLVGDCLELLGLSFEGHLGGGVVRQPQWARFLKRILYAPFRDGILVGIDMPVEVAGWRLRHSLRTLEAGGYVTTHAGYTIDFLWETLDRDIAPILVTRDPRAVVNSFVRHVSDESRRHPLLPAFRSKSETERFRNAIAGIQHAGLVLQPIEVRCRALSAWLDHSEVLHVRFEDLVGPEGGGSLEAQQDTIAAIAEHVGHPQDQETSVREHLFGKNDHTFRSGQIGGWREEIPDAVREELNAKTAPIRDTWGYADD